MTTMGNGRIELYIHFIFLSETCHFQKENINWNYNFDIIVSEDWYVTKKKRSL